MVVHPVIKVLQLGMFDQFLGAGFGFVKGLILIISLLVLIVTYPVWNLDEEIAESEFATRLLNASAPITALLPEIFESQVDALQTASKLPIRDS